MINLGTAATSAVLIIALICASASRSQTQSQVPPNRSTAFGPNACGPVDPAYIHSANETGGIPLFLQRSEAGKAFQLVRESTRSNVSTVFWGTGLLGGKAERFEIPVDSTTQRVTFAFSTDTKGNTLVVTQPSGGAIAENSASTESTELNCGRIVTVSTPEAGMWRAEIAGSGRFWLEVQSQTEIHIIKAEFVREGGRPGHEGYFRIAGQPVAGRPAMLQVSVSGKATKTAEFRLVNEGGKAIEKVELRALTSEGDLMEFAGALKLPEMPFRVAVIGRDSQGDEYQRFYLKLFHAEDVEITRKAEIEEISAGETKQLAFAVENSGAARTFKITVTDARRFVGSVSPMELNLGAGESGQVQVEVRVPPSAATGIGDDLIVLAASTSGRPTSNSYVAHLLVRGSKE